MDTTLLTRPDFWESHTATLGCPELDDHVLFETSGSSAAPKSVALSKQALLLSAAAVNRHLTVTDESCWGLALPLHHVGGFGVVARAYEAASRFAHFKQRWNPDAFRQWLATEKVTHASLVPTQVHDLVQRNLRAPTSLRAIVVGGGHLTKSLGQAARDLGWPVLASYGMTETASQIATQSLDQLEEIYQPTPLPLLPIWEARLSSDGLLEISGPALFSGYVIAGKFVARESAWHTTADLVDLTDRFISPLGRADSLVKVLGELVNVSAIEQELVEISAGGLHLGSFAVIALPDERAGNALVPVFQKEIEAERIHQWLAVYEKHCPGFRRLKPPIILDSLPLSPLGKIRRSELASLLPSRGGHLS